MSKSLIKSAMAMVLLMSSISAFANDVQNAKRLARFHLGAKECSKAVLALATVPFQRDDAEFISLYSDTYLCKADTEWNDFTDIEAEELLKSLASMKTSNEVTSDSQVYLDLNSAIEILLKFDGTNSPSTTARIQKFGLKDATALSLKALKLLLVQQGKFMALYGNSGIDGSKGQGPQSNSCIYSYVTEDAIDWINAVSPQTCISATGTEGSQFLKNPYKPQVIKRRLCEGITYFNNMIDILSNIQLPHGQEYNEIKKILPTQDTLLTMLEVAESGAFNNGSPRGRNALATTKGLTGKKDCMNLHMPIIEKWYAIYFETIF